MRCIVYAGRTALLGLLALACDGPGHAPPDGGDALDATAGAGVVVVRLGESDEGLPAEWQLEEAYLSVGEVRVDNDRGGELAPRWDEPGRLRLDEERPEARLQGAPATYFGLTLRGGEGALSFELAFNDGEHSVRVRSARTGSELALRCMEGAVGVRPGDEIMLEATLDVAPIAQRLDETAEGSGEIDEESDPELLHELESIFDTAWHLHCEGGR